MDYFYKEVTLKELEEHLKKLNEPSKYGFKSLFTIVCNKCKSEKVILYIKDESFQGSEYTGYCEDITVGVKCLSCGNAWTTDKSNLEIKGFG